MNDPARLWALAVPGILTTVNGQDHALLGGAAPSPDANQGRAEALRRDWNVNDRAELLKMLAWLAHEGHRKDFNDVCAFDIEVSARLGPQGRLEELVDDEAILKSIHFSRRHRARIGTRSLLAWDMARLILLAGWGYCVQWISEGEAWSYILAAAQVLQGSYVSWEELGQHHLLGREYWANEWVARHAFAFRSLLDDQASPWRTLPWDTDLRQPNRMIPLQEIVVAAPPPPGPLARMRNPFQRDDVHPEAGGEDAAGGEDGDLALRSEPAFSGGPAQTAPVVAGDPASGGSKVIIVAVVLTILLVVAGVAVAFALGVFAPRGGASPSRSAPSAATPAPTPPRAAPSPASPRPGAAPPTKKR